MLDDATTSRFWSKVDQTAGPDACWPWTGYVGHRYGTFYFGRRQERAHRMAWMLTNGRLRSGLCVLHRCDNPPCCNPAHLFQGTQAENVADMIAKGRAVPPVGRPGEQNPMARLTDGEVEEMRRLRAQGWLLAELSERFDVARSSVCRIVNGKQRARK